MPVPHEVFEKTMTRVDGLVLLHPQLHGIRGRPAQHVSDLLRGALVLGVGALDALVLDSVIAAIPAAARDGRLGPNVAKWVRDEPERFVAALADDDPAESVAAICRDKLGSLTFQRAAMIEGVLRDVLRRDPPWTHAAQVLAHGQHGMEVEPNDVRTELDEIVLRRHRIAHSGDLRPGGTSAATITRSYVERASVVIHSVGDGVTAAITP